MSADLPEVERIPDGVEVSDWDALISLLSEIYRPEGVALWLTKEHGDWRMTVAGMAAAGRFDDVLMKAEQLVTGAFG